MTEQEFVKKYLTEKLSEFVLNAKPSIKYDEEGYNRILNWFNGYFNSPEKEQYKVEVSSDANTITLTIY